MKLIALRYISSYRIDMKSLARQLCSASGTACVGNRKIISTCGTVAASAVTR
jgi:hypothetical protein